MLIELHPREGKSFPEQLAAFAAKGFRLIEPTDDNYGCLVAMLVNDAAVLSRTG